MQRCGALLLLFLAACGKRVELRYPPAGIDRIVLSSRTGAIHAATEEKGARLQLMIDGAGSRDELRIERRNGTLRVGSDGSPDALSFTVIAPEGLALVGSLREGDISVAGAWRELTLRSGAGRVHVDASRVEGGTLTSEKGELTFRALEPPVRNLDCTVSAGRLSMAVSSRFRGSVNLRSEVGRIEVAPHPRLRLRGEATSLSGFVGEPLTEEERREMAEGKRPGFPPGIWAHAKEGRVQFRLID